MPCLKRGFFIIKLLNNIRNCSLGSAACFGRPSAFCPSMCSLPSSAISLEYNTWLFITFILQKNTSVEGRRSPLGMYFIYVSTGLHVRGQS